MDTRIEKYLRYAAGDHSVELPEPITRVEILLMALIEAIEQGGGGSEYVLTPATTTALGGVKSGAAGSLFTVDENGNVVINGYTKSETDAQISAITALVPNQATAQNQLADKAFVNSSIANATADFRGTYDSIADLNAYSGDKNNNDYAFVKVYDPVEPTQVLQYDKYKYNGSAWVFEFTLNNSSFTAVMWAAINSGITEALVNSIPGKYVKPSGGIPASDLSANVQASLANANNAVQESSAQLTSDFTLGVNFCRKMGKLVEFSLNVTLSNVASGSTIAVLPSGYRPAERFFPSCFGLTNVNYVAVQTTGAITLGGDNIQNATTLRIHGTFIAA